MNEKTLGPKLERRVCVDRGKVSEIEVNVASSPTSIARNTCLIRKSLSLPIEFAKSFPASTKKKSVCDLRYSTNFVINAKCQLLYILRAVPIREFTFSFAWKICDCVHVIARVISLSKKSKKKRLKWVEVKGDKNLRNGPSILQSNSSTLFCANSFFSLLSQFCFLAFSCFVASERLSHKTFFVSALIFHREFVV